MSRIKDKLAALVLGLAWFGTGYCDTTNEPPKVQRCDRATYARPSMGRSFTGHIANDDYAFALNIPAELTAWDGASEEAPFHGFVLFLDPRLRACIIFEIHIRVNEDSAPKRAASAIPRRLGEAKAWQDIRTDGQLANVSTIFSFKQVDQIDDGEVLLISPESERSRVQGIYDAFVHSLTFSARSHAKP
jgi:hypothetical protein